MPPPSSAKIFFPQRGGKQTNSFVSRLCHLVHMSCHIKSLARSEQLSIRYKVAELLAADLNNLDSTLNFSMKHTRLFVALLLNGRSSPSIFSVSWTTKLSWWHVQPVQSVMQCRLRAGGVVRHESSPARTIVVLEEKRLCR